MEATGRRDGEDDVATLSNDNEFSLDIGNEEESGDSCRPDSNSEEEKRSFVTGKDGETIRTVSILRKGTSRTPQRNIVTRLPGVRGEAHTYQTPQFYNYS